LTFVFLKSQGVSNLHLASRAVPDEPVFPFSATLCAAESISKIPESLILVRLFDEIRTFLNKIQTLIDAKLLRNFALGSLVKIFLPFNPLPLFARSLVYYCGKVCYNKTIG